jgi:CheY-like chemotaxis protein
LIDTGSGIEMEAQQRIFERFEQADSSSTRRKGGAGLGLNIVRSLVEGLGGQVSVRSRVASGASFRVILPYEAVPDMAPLAPPAVTETPRSGGAPEPAAERNIRVLIADDTDANFEIAEIFLSRAGFSVSRAVNGRFAVDAAHDAEVILMDIEMPEMDGFEATSLIRQAEQLEGRKSVPILALTAHAIEGYRERCLAGGFTGYLTKPFRKEPLIAAIRAALDEAGKVS